MSATAATSNGHGGAPTDGFRSDINGLRAISIALVMAFHLAPGWAPGGFIGVDVFFVISGYLMTKIIVGRLQRGAFRLGEFYLARLRRIWPALLALCAVLLILGSFLLDPWSYERLSGDAPAAIGFFSNFVFERRDSYFAPPTTEVWLLHTWSLAVEWQFYLLYPLALLAASAVPLLKRRLWLIIAILAALSLALCLVLRTWSPQWTFYSLPPRGWELLAGGLCAGLEGKLKLGRASRLLAHIAGLGLIGVGVLLADPTGWPSATALIPVAGASLVILSAMPRTGWAENWAVAGLGRASYSIYLWHWPLIVGLRYAGVGLTPVTAAALIATMIAAGAASYWLIEQRASAWFFRPAIRRWLLGGTIVAALLGLSLVATSTRGFESVRIADAPPAVRAALADSRAAVRDWAFPAACGQLVRQGSLAVCRIGDPAARQVLVIGDSHAEQFAPRYAHAFDGRAGAGVTFITKDGCLPIPGVSVGLDGGRCAAWAAAACRWAEGAGFARVVVISNWIPYFLQGNAAQRAVICATSDCRALLPSSLSPILASAAFARLATEAARLRGQGVTVVLLGPTPRDAEADPTTIYQRLFWSRQLVSSSIPAAAFENQALLADDQLASVARLTGATFVDPVAWLCPGGSCPTVADGRALYASPGHFRASVVTGPRFAYLDPWLAPALAQPGAAAPIRLK